MQTMPLNAIVAAAKGAGGANGAASAEAGASAAGAAPGAGAAPEASGGNSFGALLAQQIKLGVQTAPQQGVPLELLKDDIKKAAADPSQLAQDIAAAHPVDPNALMDLVAQALNNLNGRPASSAPAANEENLLSSVKTTLDDASKKTSEFALPVAADNANKQPAVKDGAAAVIAESGKMLPLETEKSGTHSQGSNESMPEQFGDKLAAAQQALAQGAPTVTASSSSGDGQAVRIDRTVGSPGWGGELGQKVVWMVGQQKQSAELQLNPPNLGPLEVRLTVNQDQMTATFVSHHGAVRDAIENALPKLREMLADNGIALGNVMVGAESFAQQQQQQQQAAAQQNKQGTTPEFGLSHLGDDPVVAGASGVTTRRGEGLVNTFV